MGTDRVRDGLREAGAVEGEVGEELQGVVQNDGVAAELKRA